MSTKCLVGTKLPMNIIGSAPKLTIVGRPLGYVNILGTPPRFIAVDDKGNKYKGYVEEIKVFRIESLVSIPDIDRNR